MKRHVNIHKLFLPLLGLLFILGIILVSLISYKYELTNPFVFRHIALATIAGNEGKLIDNFNSINGYNFSFGDLYPGNEALHLIIKAVTGLQGKDSHLIPIAGLLIALLSLALVMKISRLREESYILSIFIIVFLMATTLALYCVWYYSIAVCLWLTFLIIFINYLEKNHRLSCLILLLLVFISTFFIHHRAPIWMITFIVTMTLVTGIYRIRFHSKVYKIPIFLAGAFAVIYLSFNKVLFSQYLPKANIFKTFDGVDNLVSGFYKYLGLTYSQTDPYLMTGGMSSFYQGESIFWIQFLIYVVVLIPVCMFIYKVIRAYLVKHEVMESKDFFYMCLGLAILFTAAIDMILYLFLSRLSLALLGLLLPVVFLISAKYLNMNRVLTLSLCLMLAALSISRFAILWQQGFSFDKTTYNDIRSSSSWLVSHTSSTTSLFTDMQTHGKYLVIGAESKKYFDFIYYTSKNYAAIVEHDNLIVAKDSYFVVDKKSIDKPIMSFFTWNFYEPIQIYMSDVERNTQLMKIYEDNVIVIFLISLRT